MAVTKSTTFSELDLTDAMISGNYSTLKIDIKFSANNNVTYFNGKTLKCTCNGVQQTKSVSLSTGGSVSKTFTFENISHDADGKKTVSWSWSIATGTSVLGTLKDSGTRELQTIPRASELSVSSGTHYFGENIQVTTTSKTYSKNTISYEIFGQQSGSYNTGYLTPNQTHNGTITFSPSLLGYIPNSTSATATITCASKYAVSGSSTPESDLGTSTLQVNLQVPDSVKPTCSIGTLSEANSTMLSFSPRWNIFVQNHSQINIPITANGIYGSKITSIKVTTNGETFNYNVPTPNTTINYTFTTSLLKTSAYNTINVEVTDTRGRKGTTSTTFNVVAYSSPIISSSSSVERVSSGTAGQDNLKYSFVGNSYNIGNNASMTTFKVGYKLRDSSSYTYMTSETLTGSSSINRSNVTVATPTLSSDNTYDIQFYVKDAFNEVSVVKELETEGDLLNFNDNGKAMAIGKVSEAGSNEELLEIALPTYATEKIETTKCFKIHSSGSNGYGLIGQNDASIIRDHGNGNVTLDATYDTLYLGWQHTNGINFLNGKGTMYSSGDLTINGVFQAGTIRNMYQANGTGGGTNTFVKLCNISYSEHKQGSFTGMKIYIGDGNNGGDNQNAFIDLTLQLGWTGSEDGRFGGFWELHPANTNFNLDNVNIIVIANSRTNYDVWLWTSKGYVVPNYTVDCEYRVTITPYYATQSSTPSGTRINIGKSIVPSVLTLTSGSISLTNTSGSGGTLDYVIYGKVLFAELNFTTKNSSTAVGSDCYQGTIGNAAYRPMGHSAELCGYYGSTALICTISTSGGISVRATGASIAASKSANVRGTYIIP